MDTIVSEIVNEAAIALGFKKKGSYWYRPFSEVIHVVGLQKSQWGRQYYINLAVWVNAVEKREFPKTRECHIQCRVDAVPGCPGEIGQALDEEDSWKMDADTRRDIFKLALNNGEFLFFRELRSFEDVKRFVESKSNPRCAIKGSLMAII